MVKEFARDNLLFLALLGVLALAALTDAGVTVGLVLVALGALAGIAHAMRQDDTQQRPSF